MNITANIVHSGFDGKTCWVHARPAVIPAQTGEKPTILITTYPLRLTGNDVFYRLFSIPFSLSSYASKRHFYFAFCNFRIRAAASSLTLSAVPGSWAKSMTTRLAAFWRNSCAS